MKKRLAIIVSALAVWGTLVLAQGARSPEALFKAAQHTEEVQGDLKTAIEQYWAGVKPKYRESGAGMSSARKKSRKNRTGP